MTAIYKYPIQDTPGEYILKLPADYEVVSCELQNGIPVLYVICDLSKNVVDVQFVVAYTGQAVEELDDEGVYMGYIGTVTGAQDGDIVLHIFEKEKINDVMDAMLKK